MRLETTLLVQRVCCLEEQTLLSQTNFASGSRYTQPSTTVNIPTGIWLQDLVHLLCVIVRRWVTWVAKRMLHLSRPKSCHQSWGVSWVSPFIPTQPKADHGSKWHVVKPSLWSKGLGVTSSVEQNQPPYKHVHHCKHCSMALGCRQAHKCIHYYPLMCHSYTGLWIRVGIDPAGFVLLSCPRHGHWALLVPSSQTKGHQEVSRTRGRAFRQPLCPPSPHHSSSEGPLFPVGIYSCSLTHGIPPLSFRYCEVCPHQKLCGQRMDLNMHGTLKVISLYSSKNMLQRAKKIRGVWTHIYVMLKMREKYMSHRV